MSSLFNIFGSSGGPETLNKPILGNKNYGERLVLSYLYDESRKGYVLNWVWSGDTTVNSTNNTFDINIDEVKLTGIIPNISDLSQTLREDTPDAITPTTPDATILPSATTPDAITPTTPDAITPTTPDATILPSATTSDAITPERDSIDSIHDEPETRPSVENAIRVGGKRQKKSRTTRRKSQTSGGKRRSRRAKRAIMVRHK
jgi:hypothetical protein